MTIHDRPHRVIVGAGFAGLWTTRAIARAQVEVLLLDRNNYYTFLPLLYQVAAAEEELLVDPIALIILGRFQQCKI